MLTRQSKKITTEVGKLGFLNFVRSKFTEQLYKLKLAPLGISYPCERNDLTDINNASVYKDARYNDSSAYEVILKGLSGTGLPFNEINLLDAGCGSGKVLTVAMLKHCNSVTGIDLDHAGLKKAVDHCSKMQQHGYTSPYAVYCADACTYKIPAGTNVIFMANPFGRRTMETFFMNMLRYQREQQYELYIVYAIPVYRAMFDDFPCCELIYELFNRDRVTAELTVFKIEKKRTSFKTSIVLNQLKLDAMTE